MPHPMTPDEHALLDFERTWANRPGKASAIRATFGHSSARYYQRLHALIDTERAERADPVFVHALRRMRDDAAARRASRSFAA